MKKWATYVTALLLLVGTLMYNTLDVHAAVTVADPTFNMAVNISSLALDDSYYINLDDTNTWRSFAYGTSSLFRFQISGLIPGNTYYGIVEKYWEGQWALPSVYASSSIMNITLVESSFPEGVNVSVSVSYNDSVTNTIRVRFTFYFDDYMPSLSFIDGTVSLEFHRSFFTSNNVIYENTGRLPILSNTWIEDYTGTLYCASLDTANTKTGLFHRLITSIKTSIDSGLLTVSDWLQSIYNNLISQFATVVNTIDQNDEEIMNGYSNTTASEANNDLSNASSELEEREGVLENQSNQYFDDYLSGGQLNTDVLTQLTATITFVATWFANFWNLGGFWTASLTLLFAVYVVMYILRRGGG